MSYDFANRRWYKKRTGTRWSNYILGPRRNSIRLIEHGELVVSAFRTQCGELRYSRPVTNPNSVPGSGVLYRVRVKLKHRVTA